MVILQEGSEAAKNVDEFNFLLYLEIAILVIIVLRQLYLSYKVYNKIQELKNIFKHALFIKSRFIDKKQLFTIINESDQTADESIGEELKSDITGEEIIKLSLVETNGKSPIIKSIKNGINTYLINNYGAAVNFSIIKDIIDREVDVKDEEISQTVTVQLF